ncbi:hypothetical protein SAMN04487905_10615 [Actinopolyspora xinjiangensis]|uniref:Uncharacterized protein n=1 Tax=Actinopolyspora xinjiangensis TaxID=405564 RepID=A0A1H0U2Y9_9ACTN|nr:hypothetical protein [Actinopolyspora xinjiangensis]SDP60563.1 hypothetical protein SAMN04487905_10615 [Actinopolyspora xinjiangensis]
MGQVNHPDDLLTRMKRLESELAEVRKKVGVNSATINQGGLTLKNDSYLRMIDDNGDQILYVGPDDDGRQVIEIRREGGSLLLYTAGSEQFGRDYFALTDSQGNVIVSDDAATGLGLARPWIPVPMYPLFISSTANDVTGKPIGYWSLDSSEISGEQEMWEAEATISHPQIYVTGTWGQGNGDPSITYRLTIDGTTVGTWSDSSAVSIYSVGPFDVTDWIYEWRTIKITAEVTSGSGIVGCHVRGCWLRQT